MKSIMKRVVMLLIGARRERAAVMRVMMIERKMKERDGGDEAAIL